MAAGMGMDMGKVMGMDIDVDMDTVTRCHRGGRLRNINAWYLNTHMVYL